MSRIAIPASIAAAPAGSQSLLKAVQAQLGSTPNLYRLVGVSPAALEGLLGLSGALGKGELSAQTRARIALTVAEANGCGYCLAAHTYLGKNLMRLSDVEMTANRNAASADEKADAAVRFAAALVRERGHVSEAAVQAVKAAGYSDAQLIEIIVHVAVNTLTNYVNEALKTDIDFPVVASLKAA